MKKLLIVVCVVLIAIGLVFVGIKIGTKNSSSASNNSSSQTGEKILDYSNKGLTKVGPDIYNQTNATALILSKNEISTLPSEMGRMTKLTVLKLNDNRLDGSLIADIRLMTGLIEIDASNNYMTGLPAEIGQLSKLETLNLANNRLTTLPNELGNAKALKVLNLSGNTVSQTTINKLKTELPNTQIIY